MEKVEDLYLTHKNSRQGYVYLWKTGLCTGNFRTINMRNFTSSIAISRITENVTNAYTAKWMEKIWELISNIKISQNIFLNMFWKRVWYSVCICVHKFYTTFCNFRNVWHIEFVHLLTWYIFFKTASLTFWKSMQ